MPISKAKRTLRSDREAVLAYLCGVSKKHLGIKSGTLAGRLIAQLATNPDFKFSDPLMAFYSQTNSEDRKKNAIHLYFIFEGLNQGLPNANLVDQKCDQPVYDAVVDHIFGPMINRLISETGLGRIVASSPFSGEDSLLRSFIAKKDFIYARSFKVIAPILHQELAQAYFQEKPLKMNRIHKEVVGEIFKKLKRGLELAENPRIEKYATAIEKAKIKKRKQMVTKALQRLSFSEKRILEMAFGLKSSENRGS